MAEVKCSYIQDTSECPSPTPPPSPPRRSPNAHYLIGDSLPVGQVQGANVGPHPGEEVFQDGRQHPGLSLRVLLHHILPQPQVGIHPPLHTHQLLGRAVVQVNVVAGVPPRGPEEAEGPVGPADGVQVLPEGAVEGHLAQGGVGAGETAEVHGGEVGEDLDQDLRGEGGKAWGGGGLISAW